MKIKYQPRPDKGELKMVSLRMPASLLGKLDKQSEKHGITRQRLINEILQAALNDNKLEIYLKD